MIKNILSIIIGAFFLCFAGLNNKFPLLANDSGGYIKAGFTKVVPFNRTIMYGLFVAYSSWGRSLWLVIFSQALILSLVLFYYFRYFCRNTSFIVPYLSCLFFVAFMMSASVTTSRIGPAIFAGISILCIGLLLFAENLKRRDFYIISLLLIISTGMDVSYMVISAILLIVAGVSLLFRKKEQISGVLNINARRFATTGIPVFLSWLLIFAVVRNNDIYPSSKKNIQTVIADSFYQLLNIKISQYNMQGKSSEGYGAIHKWYTDEMRACNISCQMNDWLNLNPLNYCQTISAVLCICVFIMIFAGKIISRHRNLFNYIFIAYMIYAFISATFYGINNDLQSHVAWLLPIPVFLYLSEAAIVNRWKPAIEKVFNPQ
jgi:hypothetical protein